MPSFLPKRVRLAAYVLALFSPQYIFRLSAGLVSHFLAILSPFARQVILSLFLLFSLRIALTRFPFHHHHLLLLCTIMNGVNMKLDQLFNSALSGSQFGQGLPPPSHLMAMPPAMIPLPPHMPPVMAAPFGILPPHAALGHLGHSPMHMMHPGRMQPPTSMMNSNSSLPPPPGMHSPMTVPSPQNYGFSSPVALPSADSQRSLENSQHLQLIQSIIQSTKNAHLGSGGGTSPGGLTFPHTASPHSQQSQQQQQRNGGPSLSSPNPLMNAFPSLFGNSSVPFQVPLSTPSQRQQHQQGTNQTTQQQQFSNNQHQASPGNGFLESLLSGNFQRQEQSDHSPSSSNSQDIAQSILASMYQNSPENEV